MFQEMMPMSQGGGAENEYYKEYVIEVGSSVGTVIGGKIGSITNAGGSYTGEYLTVSFSGNNVIVKTKSDITENIEVVYYEYVRNSTVPTPTRATFGANETILNTAYGTSSSSVKMCFAGVIGK